MSYILELARSSTAMAVLLISTLAMLAVAIGFLVAASVLRRANNRKAAHWAVLERNWGAAIEAIARGSVPAESLYRVVQPRERLVLLDYLYKLAVSDPEGERRALYSELASPYLSVLEARAGAGDVWQRARAIRTLAELVGGDRGGVIVAALDDEAPHVAMTAARAYARLNLGPIEPLLDRVERYQNWDRRLLRLTLASLGTDAMPTLHTRFADRTNPPRIRAVCADALADLGFEGANDTAIAALRSESDLDLRAAALRVIREPVAERHRSAVRALCTAADPVVRSQAVACLARIASPEDEGELRRAMADLSPWVVLTAARALEGGRRTETVPEADLALVHAR